MDGNIITPIVKKWKFEERACEHFFLCIDVYVFLASYVGQHGYSDFYFIQPSTFRVVSLFFIFGVCEQFLCCGFEDASHEANNIWKEFQEHWIHMKLHSFLWLCLFFFLVYVVHLTLNFGGSCNLEFGEEW